jgi:hypothetical protein
MRVFIYKTRPIPQSACAGLCGEEVMRERETQEEEERRGRKTKRRKQRDIKKRREEDQVSAGELKKQEGAENQRTRFLCVCKERRERVRL